MGTPHVASLNEHSNILSKCVVEALDHGGI